MKTTTVFYGDEAKAKLAEGIKAVYDAVSVTLGPSGNTVVITAPDGQKVTKDGVTVARGIDLIDPAANAGARLIKEASARTADIAGDGTTTSTVLAYSIISAFQKDANGMTRHQICDQIKADTVKVTDYIRAQSVPVKGDVLKCVARVSANGDEEIANAVHDAYSQISEDGRVIIENSPNYETFVEVKNGFQVSGGLNSPAWITNWGRQRAELNDVTICIIPEVLSFMEPAVKIGNAAMQMTKNGRVKPLVIIAEDVLGEALTLFAKNTMQFMQNGQGLQCAVIKSSELGMAKDQMLMDLATYCGATMLSEKTGRKPESITPDCFGSATSVTIERNSALVVGGGGSEESIEGLKSSIRHDIESAANENLKTAHKNRLSRLDSGVSVIYVGAHTPVEREEKKDRVDDAVRASRCAIKGGVVEGGGMALYNASGLCESYFMQGALKAPTKTILRNQGETEKECFTGLMELGIVDPTDVVCSALETAASVAITVLSSETLVVNEAH